MARGTLPNFIYIGPDKAGSSWLYELLKWHPQTYVTSAKDLYFFAPRTDTTTGFFDWGLDWYARQFRPAGGEKIICEISHDYLYSTQAAERINDALPGVRLMVCLREPAGRTFSAYLHMVMTGYFEGSFEDALKTHPFLIGNSLYGQLLAPYLEIFGQERIFVGVFDDLQRSPEEFAQSLFAYLSVTQPPLPGQLCKEVRAAGQARWLPAAKASRLAADRLRGMGLARLLGRIKSSTLIRGMFYRSYSNCDKPSLSPQQVEHLRRHFADDVAGLDRLLGINLYQRWGYAQPSMNPPPSAMSTC